MTTPVGFVGLGNMGAALAANLVAAGHDVLRDGAGGEARQQLPLCHGSRRDQ
ncbi:MAG: NAD(P)-binding domain-containing protein [Acidimicrobiales bacterium]